MVQLEQVQAALKQVGMRNRFWGRWEMRELQHILTPDESVIGAVNGRYEGGFAMLVATDRRLLLIDKKPMFMNMEDIRYDMISQVEFCARLVDATVSVQTINNMLRFTSIRQNHLRRLTSFMQERVMELRHMYQQQVEVPAASVPLTPQYEQTAPGQPVSAATVPSQTFAQRVPAASYYPTTPLTVKRRISRFYPLSD